MPRMKLTKTAAETAVPAAKDYIIHDTATPGFLLKVTPGGRKMFMVAYTAANGQRRKPAIGRFGAITVEQARAIAQDWLAQGPPRRRPQRRAGRRAGRADGKELCALPRRLLDPSQQAEHVQGQPGQHQRPHRPQAGPSQGAGRHPRRCRPHDRRDGAHTDGREPHARVPPQDVQHGRGLGLSTGRLQPDAPYPQVPAARADAVDHQRRAEAALRLSRRRRRRGAGASVPDARHPAAVRVRRPALGEPDEGKPA